MGNYDYVIVGSGIAGLYTALLAQEQGSVLVVTKGSIDDCVPNTVDHAKVGEHLSGDEAPGVAFPGIPVYVVLKGILDRSTVDVVKDRMAKIKLLKAALREGERACNSTRCALPSRRQHCARDFRAPHGPERRAVVPPVGGIHGPALVSHGGL